jgi:hypothetical protein
LTLPLSSTTTSPSAPISSPISQPLTFQRENITTSSSQVSSVASLSPTSPQSSGGSGVSSERSALLSLTHQSRGSSSALATANRQALSRRFILLKHFNRRVRALIPLIDFSPILDGNESERSSSLAALIISLKPLLFYDVKLDLLNDHLVATQSYLPRPIIVLNRQHPPHEPLFIQGFRYVEFTSFSCVSLSVFFPFNIRFQHFTMIFVLCIFVHWSVYSQLHFVDPMQLRQNDRAWEVHFENEGADDAGGPYRESFTRTAHMHTCTNSLSPHLLTF